MKKWCFNPIDISCPPSHTQIKHLRCAICKKLDVCSIREDYFKTAYLIQQILGDPQEDLELRCGCDKDYCGLNFEDNSIFADEIQLEDKESFESPLVGAFLGAKYRDKDMVQLAYNINNFLVIFTIKWSEEFSRYEIQTGKEVYYGLDFEMKEESVTPIQEALNTWREEQIKKEEENAEKDVINTTFFSALLNCDFYEPIKGLSEEEGLRRLMLYWKDKNEADGSCSCKPHLEHLLTYHIENKEVPYENLRKSIAPHPYLYPVFIPKPHRPCHMKKPPIKRKDQDNGEY